MTTRRNPATLLETGAMGAAGGAAVMPETAGDRDVASEKIVSPSGLGDLAHVTLSGTTHVLVDIVNTTPPRVRRLSEKPAGRV